MSHPANEYCTILDANYLPRALVLYQSLADVCDDFRLRVFCLDTETESILGRMQLAHLVTTSIDDLEAYDPGLRAVKPSRTPVEYCWTAKPVMCMYALEHDPHLERVTYVDADTLCLNDPSPLFTEARRASILLVPNRGLEGDPMGSYLAGLISFRRDDNAHGALRWWRERCFEWCFDRIEDGKCGDQRYLESWTTQFAGVHELKHPGAGVGPWNLEHFSLEQRDQKLLVDGEPLVFYHCVARWLYRGALTALPRRGFLASYYHSISEPAPLVWATAFPLPKQEHALLEETYMRRIAAAIAEIRRLEPAFEAGFVRLSVRELAYSAARRLLPRRIRQTAKRLFIRPRRKKRGPPGSPE
jgi:hypothetical protein